jgi:hypothetical protein
MERLPEILFKETVWKLWIGFVLLMKVMSGRFLYTE